MHKKNAFTLIELLIVVAIIAILAAIAVPNFLEAQVRSKVARDKADMRTMASALEAYAVDHNSYPLCHRYGVATRPDPSEPLVLERLSTPVAYITNAIVRDPFPITSRVHWGPGSIDLVNHYLDGPYQVYPNTDIVARDNSYIYQAVQSKGRAQTTTDSYQAAGLKASRWFLHSVGPDSNYHNLGGVLANETEMADSSGEGPILLIYDPTNGTVSFGSIYRTGGSPSGNADYAAGQGLAEAIQTSQ